MNSTKNPAILIIKAIQRIFAVAALALNFSTAAQAQHLPSGTQVIHGNVILQNNDTTLHLHQSTQKAILNFDTFDISSGYGVHFYLPSTDAATLARVTGPNASFINGDLTSTGNLYLINPNGLLVGKDGRILTQGDFAASTLDISNQQFLSPASNLHFIGHPQSTAWVENHGRIQAGGDIYLIGTQIRNTGSIEAHQGTAHLIAGAQELVIQDTTHAGAPRAFIRNKIDPSESLSQSTGVNNIGTIQAASIDIQAAGGIYGTAINLGDTSRLLAQGTAEIPAAIAVTTESGDIEVRGALRAHQVDRSGGSIHIDSGESILPALPVTTTIDAHITSSGLEEYDNIGGGTISILGQQITLTDRAHIEAQGRNASGGRILIGGDYQGKNHAIRNSQAVHISQQAHITADAQGSGDGGTVIIWSDRATRMFGTAYARGGQESGDGGFIEISSAGYLGLTDNLQVSAAAPNGQAGTILFDPSDITISNNPNQNIAGSPNFSSSSAASNINYNTLNALLSQGSSVVISTSGSGNGNGDITFISDSLSNGGVLNFNGNNTTLTLNADRHITIDEGTIVNINGSANNGQRLILNANRATGSIKILGNLTLDAAMDGLEAQAASIHIGNQGILMAGAGNIRLIAHQNDITLAAGGVLSAETSTNPNIPTSVEIDALKGNITMNNVNQGTQTSSLIINAATAKIKAENNITLADIQLRLNGTQDAEVIARKGSIQVNDLFIANLGNQSLTLIAAQDITQAAGADFYISTKQNLNSYFSLSADASEASTGKITLNGNLYADPTATLNTTMFASGDIRLNGSINTGNASEFIINSSKGSVIMDPHASLTTATSKFTVIGENNISLHNMELSNLESGSEIITDNGTITLGGINNITLKNTDLQINAGKDILIAQGAEIGLHESTANSTLHLTAGNRTTGTIDIRGQIYSADTNPTAALKAKADTIAIASTGQIKNLAAIDLKATTADITLAQNAKINARQMTDALRLTAARQINMADGSTIDVATSGPIDLQAHNSIRLATATLETTGAHDITIRSTTGSILDNTTAETPNLAWKTQTDRQLLINAGQSIGTPDADLNIRALAENQTIRLQAGQGIQVTESDSNVNTLRLRGATTTAGNINLRAQNATTLAITDTVSTQAANQTLTIDNASAQGRISQSAIIGSAAIPSQVRLIATQEIHQPVATTIQAAGGSVTLKTTNPNQAGRISGVTGDYQALKIDNASRITAQVAPATLTAGGDIQTSGVISIAHDTTRAETTIEDLTGRNVILTHRGPAQSNLTVQKAQSINNTDSRLMILSGRHSKENTTDNLIANDLTIAGNIQSPSQNFNTVLLAANRNVTINPNATIQTRNGGTIQIVADESNPTTIGDGRITNNGTLNAGSNGQVVLYSNRQADTKTGTIIATNSADSIGNRYYQTNLGNDAYNPASPIANDIPSGQSPGADLYKVSGTGGNNSGGGNNNGGNNDTGNNSGGGNNNSGNNDTGNNSGGGNNNGGNNDTGNNSGGGNNNNGSGNDDSGNHSPTEEERLAREIERLRNDPGIRDIFQRAATEGILLFTQKELSEIAQKGVYSAPWDFMMAEIFMALNLANQEIPDTLRMWQDKKRRTFVGEKRPDHINVEGLPDAVVYGIFLREYWGRYSAQDRIEMIRKMLEKRYQEKRRTRGTSRAGSRAAVVRTEVSDITIPAPNTATAPSPSRNLAPANIETNIDPSFFRPTITPPDGGRPIIKNRIPTIRRQALPPEDSGTYRIILQ